MTAENAPDKSRRGGGARTALLGLAAALALGAAGCGKKPDGVLPPQGEENDTFPRTYPSE